MKNHIHKIIGLYVFIVLFIWSLPRVVSFQQVNYFFYKLGFEIPYLNDFYLTQFLVKHTTLLRLLPVLIFISLIIFALFLPLLIKLFNLITRSELEKVDSKPISPFTIWTVSVFVVLILLFKEWTNPFFFTQDDNHTAFFPKILVWLRSLFNGEFPFIDNYQFFGAPLFESGIFAVMDPLMIFSYVIAKFFLNNEYATLEIYIVFCTLIGSVFLGYSLKQLKIDALIGAAAILSFSLLGYFLIIGKSWYYVYSIVCYLPILLYFFVLAISGRLSWLWFLSLGIFRGLFFFAGNAQFFLYGAFMELVSYFYAAFGLKDGKKIFLHYFCSLILTFGVVLPLLVPQLYNAREVFRSVEPIVSGGLGEVTPFDAFVFSSIPYFTFINKFVSDVSSDQLFMLNMYHIGVIWMICFFLGLASYFRLGKIKFIPILILAIFLLLLSAGPVSLIYPLKYFIPVLNKMQKAFKLYPFAAFAIIVYGALTLNYIRRIRVFRHVLIYPVVFSVLVTLAMTMFGADVVYYRYADKPYPKLTPGIAKNIEKNDIVFSFAPWRYPGESFVSTLGLNYSCLYDIMSANIFDPFFATRLDHTFATRIWETSFYHVDPYQRYLYFLNLGITKIIVPKFAIADNMKLLLDKLKALPLLYEDRNILLYSTNNKPWILRPVFDVGSHARFTSGENVKVNYYSRNKIKAIIDSPKKSLWEYHNEYRPGYYVLVDGKKTDIVTSKAWCAFEVSHGQHSIEVGYVPKGFWLAVLIGTGLMFLSLFLFIFQLRFFPINS